VRARVVLDQGTRRDDPGRRAAPASARGAPSVVLWSSDAERMIRVGNTTARSRFCAQAGMDVGAAATGPALQKTAPVSFSWCRHRNGRFAGLRLRLQ
jgi:hypothetical protein